MGALTRFRALLLNQYKSKVRTYQHWVQTHTADQLAIHPGLTVGATQLVLGERIPTANGETDGEVYVSNDLTPLQAWIWQGAAWELLTESPTSTKMTVGATQEVFGTGVYYPIINGTVAGEFYLSNDRTPPCLYVWSSAWYQVGLTGPIPP